MDKVVADMEGTDPGLKRRWFVKIPLWQGNVIFFLILFSMAVSYFFFQIRQAQNLFVADAGTHARLVAGVLRLHVKGTVISEDIINSVMSNFLANSAEFVKYLDSVEPFTADELKAFAMETGLLGILIVRDGGQTVSGPSGWLTEHFFRDNIPVDTLQYVPENHLVLFRASGSGSIEKILLGIDARDLEIFHRNVGLPKVLSEVERLGGIRYIRPEKPSNVSSAGYHVKNTVDTAIPAEVIFRETVQGMVAEVPIAFGQTRLVLGLDAEPLRLNKRRLWREFFIFSVILACLGGLLSYLLYRQQLSYVNEMQEYDRRLALQREEAALGRSAAAIAHEIRNPLNAMAIALQRLSLEAGELTDDHRRLIDILLDSVNRTDSIINGLLHYTGLPESISKTPVALSVLLQDVITLYKSRFAGADISLSTICEDGIVVYGDKNLLAQVLENLFRNASEAQPHGGRIAVSLSKAGDTALLTMTNSGDIPELKEMDRIFSPYVTLKTRGTGLGLAITKKIIKAHGGVVQASVTPENLFEIKIILPLFTDKITDMQGGK